MIWHLTSHIKQTQCEEKQSSYLFISCLLCSRPHTGCRGRNGWWRKVAVSFCFGGDGKGRGRIQKGTETTEGAAAWRKGYGGLPGGSGLSQTMGQEKVKDIFLQEVAWAKAQTTEEHAGTKYLSKTRESAGGAGKTIFWLRECVAHTLYPMPVLWHKAQELQILIQPAAWPPGQRWWSEWHRGLGMSVIPGCWWKSCEWITSWMWCCG